MALSTGGLDLIVFPGVGFTKVLCGFVSVYFIFCTYSLMHATVHVISGRTQNWLGKGKTAIKTVCSTLPHHTHTHTHVQGFYDRYYAKCVQTGFKPKTVGRLMISRLDVYDNSFVPTQHWCTQP